jgi:pyridoxine kinase
MAILSIQSHVALGHVGNRAAVFALERLGFEVWPINTVHLSHHPGHGQFVGRVADVADVSALLDGLARLGAFARCQAVLSGYLGSLAIARVALDVVRQVKAANPAALYVCDPVIGDRAEGRYVAEDLVEFFRDSAVPVADWMCPNAFELACLTGQATDTVAAVLEAADSLLGRGPRAVIVTSLIGADIGTDHIGTLAVTGAGAWLMTTPRLALAAKGSGDLLAALLVGRYLKDGDLPRALESAVAGVYAIVASTDEQALDLALVAAQEKLLDSGHRFEATRLR